jgi:hypothetical protein
VADCIVGKVPSNFEAIIEALPELFMLRCLIRICCCAEWNVLPAGIGSSASRRMTRKTPELEHTKWYSEWLVDG